MFTTESFLLTNPQQKVALFSVEATGVLKFPSSSFHDDKHEAHESELNGFAYTVGNVSELCTHCKYSLISKVDSGIIRTRTQIVMFVCYSCGLNFRLLACSHGLIRAHALRSNVFLSQADDNIMTFK